MQFRPQIIELGIIELGEAPVDEDGELELPADLLALGAQLQLDAAVLAECYPAETDAPVEAASRAVNHGRGDEFSGDEPTKRGRGHERRRLAVLAAGLVSLSLLATLAVLRSQRDPVDAGQRTAQHETARRETSSPQQAGRELAGMMQPTTDDARSKSSFDESAAAAAVRSPETSAELSPIMFLQEVSAPELEGWCDLIEEGETDGADLSI